LKIELVFITYNRLDYTRLSLASVLSDPTEQFMLTIWDNASTDGTVEYLKNNVSDSRIKDIILSKENIGQTAAVNKVWGKSNAELLGKLDNDCLVTPGWTRALSKAQHDIDNLGVVACWPFFSHDFSYQKAMHKIQKFGDHRILRHPWTCGTGLLIKNETYRKCGPIENRATTQYWLKVARAGYVNGFYFPLILQEHMDDPMSKYCRSNNEISFAQARKVTFGMQSGNYHDWAGRFDWRKEILRNLLEDPYDVQYYAGWRAKWRRLQKKIRQRENNGKAVWKKHRNE